MNENDAAMAALREFGYLTESGNLTQAPPPAPEKEVRPRSPARCSLTPEQRTLRARAAAFAQHAQGKTNTSTATTAFLARFEAEVDPDGTLTPEERGRRAAFAKKAYFARLALKSSRVRAARRQGDTF